MGAGQKWVLGAFAGLSLVGMVGAARGGDVSDADRAFKNFVSETAVVNDQQFRIEVRG
ncbi:MAG: hypothetical protein HY270_12975, partial [Deltaproteobacteria bacterium]|nr:hypothetical protein [Deltaproteobacteria bacterium]